jgi:hypothetical protein
MVEQLTASHERDCSAEMSTLPVTRRCYLTDEILCQLLHRMFRLPTLQPFIYTPLIGRGGRQGCESSRLPYLPDNLLTDGSEVISLTRWQPFTPPPPGRLLVLISVRG